MATIQKRRGSYYIVVSLGYDSSGQQVRKTMTWKPPEGMTERQREKEAKRQAVLFEDKIKTNQSFNQRIKLYEFFPIYFSDYGKANLKEKTYFEYQRYAKRCEEHLGHLRLAQIKPKHIIDYCNYLSTPEARQQPGGRTKDGKTKRQDKPNEGLSPKTIKLHFSFISSVLAKAVKWGYINTNPCDRVDAPKVTAKIIECMDESDIHRYFKAIDSADIQTQLLFHLDLLTGMRRGELLALTWDDVDFKHSTISIKSSMSYVPRKGQFITTTKTERWRINKLPDNVMQMLKLHRAEQLEKIAKLGDYWQHPEMVFTNKYGRYMDLNTPYKTLKKILRENNLPDCTVHSFRHATASLLIAHGADIKTIADYIGHSSPTTTLQIYAYQIASAKAAAEKALADVLEQTSIK